MILNTLKIGTFLDFKIILLTPFSILNQKLVEFKGRVGIEPTTLSLKGPALLIELPTQLISNKDIINISFCYKEYKHYSSSESRSKASENLFLVCKVNS